METKIAESQTATLVAERNESEEIKRKFSAGEFEGPLDLLWFLIHKSEINIYDIPIAQITEQYLEYLDYATQTDLADRIFVSFQAISSWECGSTLPDVENLCNLAKVFKVSVDELLQKKEVDKEVKFETPNVTTI